MGLPSINALQLTLATSEEYADQYHENVKEKLSKRHHTAALASAAVSAAPLDSAEPGIAE